MGGCSREVVDNDKMQYGFIPGKGTVDPVNILSRLVKNSEPKTSCLLYLLTWKRLLIGKLFVLL